MSLGPKMKGGADEINLDVLIYGGGLCGALAGHRCVVEGLTYYIIEKESDFGGVWHTLANEHSHLQVLLQPVVLVIHTIQGLPKQRRRSNGINSLLPAKAGLRSNVPMAQRLPAGKQPPG